MSVCGKMTQKRKMENQKNDCWVGGRQYKNNV